MRRLVVRLCAQLDSFRASGRNSPAVRRVVNTVERLEIDLAELIQSTESTATDSRTMTDQRSVVVVPDTPYDPGFWRGADDEGVGGHRRDHG
ncbi:hypothetical protein ACQPW3_22400 [Actinosynnema sp. CA-248983]